MSKTYNLNCSTKAIADLEREKAVRVGQSLGTNAKYLKVEATSQSTDAFQKMFSFQRTEPVPFVLLFAATAADNKQSELKL